MNKCKRLFSFTINTNLGHTIEGKKREKNLNTKKNFSRMEIELEKNVEIGQCRSTRNKQDKEEVISTYLHRAMML